MSDQEPIHLDSDSDLVSLDSEAQMNKSNELTTTI